MKAFDKFGAKSLNFFSKFSLVNMDSLATSTFLINFFLRRRTRFVAFVFMFQFGGSTNFRSSQTFDWRFFIGDSSAKILGTAVSDYYIDFRLLSFLLFNLFIRFFTLLFWA